MRVLPRLLTCAVMVICAATSCKSGDGSDKPGSTPEAVPKATGATDAPAEQPSSTDKPADGQTRVITIASNPGAAKVSLEGAELGRTPYQLRIMEETVVQVSLPGFMTKQLTVNPAGDPNIVVPLTPAPTPPAAMVAPPQPATAGLPAPPEPPPAVVPTPPKPVTATLLDPAPPAPALPAKPTPAVAPGVPPTAAPTARNVVNITLATNPAAASVKLAGALLGVTPLSVQIRARTTIRISKAGYVTQDVVLDPAGPPTVAVALKRAVKKASRPSYRSFRAARAAYKAGKLSGPRYDQIKARLKAQRKQAIVRAKFRYESGKINKAEYKRRRRAIDARFD